MAVLLNIRKGEITNDFLIKKKKTNAIDTTIISLVKSLRMKLILSFFFPFCLSITLSYLSFKDRIINFHFNSSNWRSARLLFDNQDHSNEHSSCYIHTLQSLIFLTCTIFMKGFLLQNRLLQNLYNLESTPGFPDHYMQRHFKPRGNYYLYTCKLHLFFHQLLSYHTPYSVTVYLEW